MKKALLLSYQKNWRGVNNWEDLLSWQFSQDLSQWFKQPVDVRPWSELKDFTAMVKEYDTVIIHEFPIYERTNSSHFKYLSEFLRKFVGKKYAVNIEDDVILPYPEDFRDAIADYYANDITEQVLKYRKSFNHIIFGNCAAAMWQPNSYIAPFTGFRFICEKRYQKATIFFSDFYCKTKPEIIISAKNLQKRIMNIDADEVVFVMPLRYNIYGDFQFELLYESVKAVGATPIQPYDIKAPNKLWRYPLWDWKTNAIKDPSNYRTFIETD